MKKLSCLQGLFILLFVACQSPENKTASASATDDGWVELINGKDFTGWKATENTGTWTVQEGYFQAAGKRSHLFYEGRHLKNGFRNFELEVQVRTFPLANSGIYFHTEYQEAGWPSKGLEIQVNNTHIGEGDFVELKKMASLYGVRNMYKSFGRDGEWMTVKARVESNHVQVWLNGIRTVDYIQPEKTLGVRRLGQGTFCLQGHDSLSKMQYRSFRVRRLPDTLRTYKPAPVWGAWHDSLIILQSRQYAFIDLNPPESLPATELAEYVYTTGINVALVKDPASADELTTAQNLPLFTGIKVTAAGQNSVQPSTADYIIGESRDAQSAEALLNGPKINIWSDKGMILNSSRAAALLDKAKENNIAIEIDNLNQHPSIAVIKLAKSKGCKFSFAGLTPEVNMQRSQYVMTAIKLKKRD